MKTYVTSDLHFGHSNIKKFCPITRSRFSDNTDEMNEQMVKEWNEIVTPKDTVYILGDVAFMPAMKAALLVKRLNGRKILIEGNHDQKALKDLNFQKCFAEIHKYLEVKYNGHKICMFHYPIAEWNQMHRGALQFHGHLHGNVSGLEGSRAIDVGMDATGWIVLEMEDAIDRAMKGEIRTHHQKGE